MTTTIRRPGTRAARAGFLAAPFVGLAIAVALVWQSSYAAFSSTTENGVNEWEAGSVTLTDTDTGQVMFDASGLKPGSTETKCIQVTKTGDLAGTVKLYGRGLATTKNLSQYIDLVIDQGTGNVTGGSCTNFSALGSGASVYNGTLAGFTATTFAGGYGDWAPAANSQTRSFRFTYTLNNGVDNNAQGGTAGITFVWESQNS